jgi:centromere protein B
MATKRKKLTILEKAKIIHEVENNPKTPAIEIARKFNLPPSSLSCIMKKKESIVDEEVKRRVEANKRNYVYLIQNIM